MDITLSIEQQEEAKELLKKLTELYRARVELESIKAGRIEKLQYEVAGELDLKNKNGDVEPKLVKKPILLSALESKTGEKNSKYELEFNIFEDYKHILGNGAISKDITASIVNINDELNENKLELKEAFKETSFLDKDILEAISIMAKQKYEEFKMDKKIENGEEVKPKKDKTEIYEYVAELESILKDDSEQKSKKDK